MLNWIWAGFFAVAFLAGLFRWLVLGEPGVWAAMVGSTFEMAKTGFEISLGLTGIMCLWLGIMRVGERGGAVALVARAFDPLLRRLFPGIPKGHPASASIVTSSRPARSRPAGCTRRTATSSRTNWTRWPPSG